ncbi:ABC transporter permease [Aerobium aerolatum]|uniref:Osmoprotectant transport system permease protein n=1 Tax=Aquamicrobium aerolatum DSM 21857 TaxID=1121003 RepID=A0A1I3RWJ7_9HYPH|nr:ABC transporter permease [Aquamicrobium aerolatum]SFJ50775.1 osmoprotectant transport system permease protein [Aquamicrobium aerolatum DSM 21857]
MHAPARPASGQRAFLATQFDRLGILIALLAAYGVAGNSFVSFRLNRIVPGQGVSLWASLPSGLSYAAIVVVASGCIVALVRSRPVVRAVAGIAVVACMFALVGLAGENLLSDGDELARVSPAAGFWLVGFAFSLLSVEGLSRMSLRPGVRVALLAAVTGTVLGALSFGVWDDLSIMNEYRSRSESFWSEAATHLQLAFGSMAAAVLVGVPLGLLCFRMPRAKTAILTVLNTVQTVPSMAMFGLMIAPLGWIALHVPGASALGIRGIGAAPAFIALFLYSLLPVVANTVAGLANVSATIRDAARGMGMTWLQKLLRIELPIAFPVILTGIRIVLVQNIGLVTIAALIGGGGFGTFVFQGIGQMAMDLVLLGAVPTVALAFGTAVVLDAVIDASSVPTEQRADT